MLTEFFTHSDSGIADNELIIGIAIWCLIGLLDPEADGSTGFIKFDSIVQNIQQNLVQSEFICNNVLVFDIDHINQEIKLFGSNVRLNDRADIVHQIRQMQRSFFDFDFSAFDPAHVEYIIDKRKQMFTGS